MTLRTTAPWRGRGLVLGLVTALATGLALTVAAPAHAAGGAVAGRVLKVNGQPLAGVCVTVITNTSLPLASATTGGDGRYRMDGVRAGQIFLEFSDCSGGPYLHAYYDGVGSPDDAVPLGVTDGGTTNARAVTMERPTTIAGRVTDPTGAAAPDVCVNGAGSGARTGNDGRYTIENVRSGRYFLEFTDCGTGDLAGEWYDDQPDRESATPLLVSAETPRTGIDAQLASTAAVSGTVTGPNGLPPYQACVTALDADHRELGEARTDELGHYRITGLPTGQVVVRFADCYYTLVPEFWRDAASFGAATPVAVSAGTETPDIDARLVARGSLAGRITDPSGAPIHSVQVVVRALDGTWLGSVQSGSDGLWTVPDLPRGPVTVVASDPSPYAARVAPTFYPRTPDESAAARVEVRDGVARGGIDIQMIAGATVSGRITRPDGTPVVSSTGCAQAQALNGGVVATTSTDADGRYSLTGLAAGSYRVHLGCGTHTGLADEWWDGGAGAADPAIAAPVTLTAGEQRTGIDAVLSRTATLRGTTRDGSGAPLGSVCVTAYRGEQAQGSAASDATTGAYEITQLRPGSYDLRASDCGGRDLRPVWHPGVADRANATHVTLGENQTRTGVDPRMPLTLGRITGTVTGPDGAPVVGCVGAVGESGTTTAYADQDGRYTLAGLEPGYYRLQFSDCGSGALLSQWYPGRATEAAAVPVRVDDGTVTANARLQSAGTVTGRVTGADGQPLPGICVSAQTPDGLGGSGNASTGSDGRYTIRTSAAGGYLVSFVECNSFSPTLVREWYPDAHRQGDAATVAVGPGSGASGIDVVMDVGGTITGVVKDSAGARIASPCARVYDASGELAGYADVTSSGSGVYRVRQLPAGSYTVQFCADATHLERWSGGARTRAGATPVRVALGRYADSVDAVLPLASTITGTVTEASGAPAGLCVRPYDAAGVAGTEAGTDSDGYYRLTGLEAGSYRLRFGACSNGGSRFEPEWYADQPSLAAATPVTVAAGDVRRGVDVVVGDDLAAPETVVSRPAEGATVSPSTSVVLATDPDDLSARYRCRIDAEPMRSCDSYVSLDGLANGPHTVTAVAIDAAGNQDPTPAVRHLTLDGTAPDTSISSGPAEGATVDARSVAIGLASPATDVAGFECRLDGGPWGACTSPLTLDGLRDGGHTVQARAVDAVGNTDATPVGRSFVVTGPADTTAPDTALTDGPAEGALVGLRTVTLDFAGAPAADTVGFECRLDAGAWTACGSPRTASGLADGSHSFAVRALDEAGNADATPATRTFRVDATAPDTRITSGPAEGDIVTTTRVSFGFGGVPSADATAFECRLDDEEWAACASPATVRGLTTGNHAFAVRARDAAGNADPTPATRSFFASIPVDETPPDTAIVSGPAAGATTGAAVSFGFGGTPVDDVDRFECRLDTGPWATCTSPRALGDLTSGRHTFAVRAVDAAGNADPTPASRAFVVDTSVPVDTTPPETAVTSGPADGATLRTSTATFGFAGAPTADTAGFECRLDAGAWTACPSPRTFTGLADAGHTVQVRAFDAAGNVDPTPAVRTFTVAAAACTAARATLTRALTEQTAAGRQVTKATATVTALKKQIKQAHGAARTRLQKKLQAAQVALTKAKTRKQRADRAVVPARAAVTRACG